MENDRDTHQNAGFSAVVDPPLIEGHHARTHTHNHMRVHTKTGQTNKHVLTWKVFQFDSIN